MKTSTIPFVVIFFILQLIRLDAQQSATAWKSIGPPGVGYNSSLKFDSSSGRLYLFGKNELYYSFDRGESWIDISPQYITDSYSYDFVVSSENSDELYFLNIGQSILYKSTNAGNTWVKHYTDKDRYVVFLDKHNPNIFIAQNPTGGWGDFFQTLEKSTDAGVTWIGINDGIDTTIGPLEVWVNPYSSNLMIAKQIISWGGDVIYGDYIFRSTNGGQQWTKMSIDSSNDFQAFIFDPFDQNAVYTKRVNKPWLKSTNGGDSWFELGVNLSEKAFSHIFISPYDTNVVYTSISQEFPDEGSDIYKSVNGGIEWEKFSSLPLSQRISSLLVDPFDHNEFYVSSYPYGVYKSVNNGQHWALLSNGLNQTEVCSFSATTPEILYAGIGNRGLYRTDDGGKNWKLIYKNLSSCPERIVVSKNDPHLVFTNAMLFSSSTDGGDTWNTLSSNYEPENFDVASDNKTLYGDAFMGNNNGLPISGIIKSTNGGASWESLNLNIENINYIDKIETDPFDNNIVYAIVAIRGVINKNSLIKTSDGGTHWKIIADTAVNFFINRGNSQYIYHTYGDYISISDDSGETFSNHFIGYQLKDIVSHKTKIGELYGIPFNGPTLISTDNGHHWNSIEELQLDAGIQDLQLSYSDSGKPILFGSTWYNGILKYELDDLPASIVFQNARRISFELRQNYPNPFNSSTTITYQLPQSNFVKLIVYNILGKVCAVLVNEMKDAGAYSVPFNTSALASGIYFYHLRAGEFTATKKMVVVK